MDFEPTEDQVALRDATRAFCEGRFPMAVVRAHEEDGGRLDRRWWRELGDTGVFSLRLPEADGGANLGVADAVLVFEELGRALVPGPVVATHLAAELVPGAASGERIVGLTDSRAEPQLVEHPDSIDTLLILGDEGIRQLDPSAVELAAVARPLDPLTPVALAPAGLPAAERVADRGSAARWQLLGAVLTGGYLIGMASRTVELATAYAQERQQFGRPIGSFQAVKHLIADMLVKAEVARAAVHAAAVTWDQPEVGDVGRAASAAKLLAGEAARFCAKTCIQVHGGMGFTWEVDAQRYWKRACVLETHFGGADEHAQLVAASIE